MTNCKNCSVMEILLEFQRNLYRDGSTKDALDDAITHVTKPKPVTAKKGATGAATCMDPDCKTPIRYGDKDKTRPLYCPRHMNEHEGRNVKAVK